MALEFHGGRLPAPDPRDGAYPVRLLLAPIERNFPRGIPPGTRYYNASPILSQGETGTCVLHAVASFLHGAPIMSKPTPETDPFAMYDLAIVRDEFDDNDRDPQRQYGTSVRAGVEVARSYGRIASYLWAQTVDEAIAWHLANLGTAIIGMIWRTGMMETDLGGFVRATGGVEGGHAIKTTGWSDERQAFRCQQSWGRRWGQDGRFWLHRSILDEQLAGNVAEICCPTEIRVFPQP
jgi:hypothetical protein